MIRTIDFGVENGANVLIISGVHGDEVGAIKTSYDLYDKLQEIKESGKISRPIGYPKLGKVSFIHVANREGVRNGCRNMVYDGNLNNMFSTSPDPKCEIIKAIDDAQFVIDLHCSPYVASGFIFDIDYKSFLYRNFLDDKFFFELSSTELSYGIRHTEANTIKSYVNSLKGKIGFTWEQNGMNQHSLVKNVDILVKIISSFTNFSEYVENIFNLKLYDDGLSKQEIPLYAPHVSTIIASPTEGILTYHQSLGAVMPKDSIIATIRSLNGNRLIHSITAPFDCKFISGNVNLYVRDNEFVAMIEPYNPVITS